MSHAFRSPTSFLSLALLLPLGVALASGCRDDNTNTGGSGAGTSDGGDSSDGGNNTGAGNQGGDNQGGDGEGGGIVGCEGPVATIEGITTGEFGPGSKVSVNGVVAMSHKFLVSKSSSDSCLWGVFVSAPGLTTTEANSGLLVLSYGFKAEIPKGGDQSFCPRLGQDEAGDMLPDNVKPGDVLDLIGTVNRFPEDPNCTGDNPPNQVGMLQLSNVCSATPAGTATPPAPKVLTADEIESISSTDDQAFHDAWGGVKVRVEDVTVAPQSGDDCPDMVNGETGPDPCVVGNFGVIKLTNGVELGNKIYYRGYSNNVCHEGPVFPDTAQTWEAIQGFHYLNFCSWGIQPNEKCGDFEPSSGDCGGDAVCEPDFID